MADATEVNAAAWVKMLRGVWTARPSLAGARAVLSMCRNMLEVMLARTKEMGDDHFTRAGMKSWHADFDRAVARLSAAADGATLAFTKTQPSSVDRVSMLTAFAMGPVLDGVYPVGYCDGAPPDFCKGLVLRPGGTFKGMGVAFDVASLWNRLAAARATADVQLDIVPDFVAEWLTQAEHQLSEAAPGEEPTVYDDVGAALDAAKETVADIGRAAAGKLLLYAGIGVAVVVGAFLLLRDR